MIDIFNKYVSNYDINNQKVKLKHDHSLRVMELCIKYAKKLGFNDCDVKLASVIGLFHDIGRFEQLKLYNTFSDLESIDHAHLGVEILFKQGLINEIWKNKEDYELIEFAIENHNKLEIAKTDNERFMKFAKLIRDADKTDIIYLRGNINEYYLKTTDEPVCKEALDEFNSHKCVSWKNLHNDNDNVVINLSYVFDINNVFVLDEVKDHYKLVYDSLEHKEKFKEMYEELIKYIDWRIKNEISY